MVDGVKLVVDVFEVQFCQFFSHGKRGKTQV